MSQRPVSGEIRSIKCPACKGKGSRRDTSADLPDRCDKCGGAGILVPRVDGVPPARRGRFG